MKSNPTPTSLPQPISSSVSGDSTDGRFRTQDDATHSIQGKALLWKRFALFFCIATVGVVADLFTKSLTFRLYFDPAAEFQRPHYWIDGVFGIQTATNPGALFGMGSGYSWVFAILSIVALVAVLAWLFAFKGAYDLWLTCTLGLISGGILGNLYDRLGWGATPGFPASIRTNVRDWILFRLEGVPLFDPWPNFNLADCWLVCGAALLFFHTLFLVPPESESSDQTQSPA